MESVSFFVDDTEITLSKDNLFTSAVHIYRKNQKHNFFHLTFYLKNIQINVRWSIRDIGIENGDKIICKKIMT